jgi:hypothetical protein
MCASFLFLPPFSSFFSQPSDAIGFIPRLLSSKLYHSIPSLFSAELVFSPAAGTAMIASPPTDFSKQSVSTKHVTQAHV